MKKMMVLFLTFAMIFVVAPGAIAATWEWDGDDYEGVIPEDSHQLGGDTIATITFVFIDGRSGTTEVSEKKGEDHDVTIENYLKWIWDKEYDVKQITHIDGVPIEQTKWKKFAGVIRTSNPLVTDGNNNAPKSPAPSQNGDKGSVKVGDTVYRPFEVTVTVDGDEVVFPDQKPYEDTKAYRTMVPLRAVYEHHNVQAEVIWNQKQQTVTATNPKGEKVVFTIGKKEFLSFAADGTVKTLYSDAAPVVIKGRTYLPLRALGSAWGIETLWFKDQKLVQMTTPDGYRQYLAPKDEYLAKKGA